ncbi:hypothetical protein NQZ68_027507 [Dissostichus eleginoides]|nr:hypothetical protein NQZ68_027507 [Dissostichus eleginoides]
MRQIHPHCLRTNEPIHLEAPIDKRGGKYSTNAWEGSGERASGPAILFLAHIPRHSQPPPHSTRFHWQVTGERHEWGSPGHLGPGPDREDGTQVPLPLDGSSGPSHKDG